MDLPFILAERLGFEPRVTQKSHNGFRDRPDQPLWHLSVRSWRDYSKETGFLQPLYHNPLQSGTITPRSRICDAKLRSW